MTKLISAPTNEFLLQEHPVNMHVETTDWLSELEFCKTELSFLTNLLKKVFLNANNKKRMSEAASLEKKVKLFSEKTLKELHGSVIKHEQHLASLDENAFAQDESVIKKEHGKEKLSVIAFMGSVKKVKKEVFDFFEVQMKQTKKIISEFEEGSMCL